jgi:hypothetical protein
VRDAAQDPSPGREARSGSQTKVPQVSPWCMQHDRQSVVKNYVYLEQSTVQTIPAEKHWSQTRA